MTTRNQQRQRNKGRRTSGSFLSLYHRVLESECFRTLSPRATKLLIDISAQYKGTNNGDLSATFRQMKARGWNSSDQLNKAKKELIDRGLILVARQGGLKKCNLYAITWEPIDDCNGKIDIQSTQTAPHYWKQWVAPKCGPKS